MSGLTNLNSSDQKPCSEHPFLKEFGSEWGTAKKVEHGIYSGPYVFQTAYNLKERIDKWFQSTETHIFKGVVGVQNPERKFYYVYVPKSELEKKHLDMIEGLPEVLPDDPITLLNHRVDSDAATIKQRLLKHFKTAQTWNNDRYNAEWGTADKYDPQPKEDLGAIVVNDDSAAIISTPGNSKFLGSNPYNEDKAIATVINISVDNNPISIPLYGIFDGHCAKIPGLVKSYVKDNTQIPDSLQRGKKFAEYIAQKIPARLQEKLQKALEHASSNTLSEEELLLAFQNCFKLSAVELSEEASDTLNNLGGTTCTLACIFKGMLFVANCGDSRAIISTPAKSIAMCTDASFDNTDEWEKFTKQTRGVINRGSYPIMKADGRRVPSGLGMTRALGHKLSEGINPRAELVTFSLDELLFGNNFLVMFSDGLCDVASSSQISEAVQSMDKAGATIHQIARRLVQHSLKAGSIDNITALVVKLPARYPKKLSTKSI